MTADIDALRPGLAAGLDALDLPAALAAPLLAYLALLARGHYVLELPTGQGMVIKH